MPVLKKINIPLRIARIMGIQVFFQSNSTNVIIHTGAPGILIGMGGSTFKDLTKILEETFHTQVNIQLNEIKTFKENI